jgi:TatD DNase family protein
MIDTHAHLSRRFCDIVTIDPALKVILAASNLEDSEENVILARQNPKQFWAAVGIHPQKTDPERKESTAEQINKLKVIIENNRDFIAAIGETGIDLSPAPPEEEDRTREEQEELFRAQIKLSLTYNLPLVVHSRKAMEETLSILGEYKNLKGVIHCYTGGKKRISKVLDLGENWFLGIDGNVTYEAGLAEVVAAIPKDRLILETDSPFLAPIPHRGETNRPEYVRFVYQKVADIWQLNSKETEELIDRNAQRLFAIDTPAR